MASRFTLLAHCLLGSSPPQPRIQVPFPLFPHPCLTFWPLVDVIKTRYMGDSVGAFKSPLHCLLETYREGGLKIFFRVSSPSLPSLLSLLPHRLLLLLGLVPVLLSHRSSHYDLLLDHRAAQSVDRNQTYIDLSHSLTLLPCLPCPACPALSSRLVPLLYLSPVAYNE
jgi:hypothetical protein